MHSIHCINTHDVEGLTALASHDCTVSMEDMTVMPQAVYVKACEELS
jgi:hypothetical protein